MWHLDELPNLRSILIKNTLIWLGARYKRWRHTEARKLQLEQTSLQNVLDVIARQNCTEALLFKLRDGQLLKVDWIWLEQHRVDLGKHCLISSVHINHQPFLERGDGPICLVLAPTWELA
ncbi:hypothetical protein QTO34_016586 [Cnephaeus nilssonii]|uniref:Uncharacterized protein n=1 Tax=Cnephaeus nilssonii TaxID=3371016 RepID=A0AA40LQF7_CNENI|nr:hypothetical protein QTO34_016586 [Eptesicus nilssonii]